MTYHINVSEHNLKEFLQIIHSLHSLGVVESYESNRDLVSPGDPLAVDTLLNILSKSKSEIASGKSYSMEEVKKQIDSWKKK